MGAEEEDVFCICRSSDQTRFMIGCDQCEEWYHGDCINISAAKSRTIKRFFCPPCREVNPSLEIQYQQGKRSKKAATRGEEDGEEEVEVEGPRRCGQCIGCFRSDDCGRCDACKKGIKDGCRLRQCVNAVLLKESAKKRHSSSSTGGPKRKAGRPPNRAPKVKNAVGGRGKQRDRSSGDKSGKVLAGGLSGTRSSQRALQKFMEEAGVQELSMKEDDSAHQCEGPKCVKAARKQSKYCSDDCGMAMARKRLNDILPKRLEEWKRQPIMADLRQRFQLEDVRKKQEAARAKLTDLDLEEKRLKLWLAEIKGLKPGSKEEQQEVESDSEDSHTVFCATCGGEIASKTALKHQMKCFSKYESQASYGSAFKAQNNLYEIFCDTFNKVNSTYCKRLRVICPEHSKDSRSGDEICGYPIGILDLTTFPDVSALKEDDSQEKGISGAESKLRVCKAERKKCLKHHQWSKLRRAMIDQERLNHLLKLDELFEEERSIRVAMASRGGLLALLLHSTQDHSVEKA